MVLKPHNLPPELQGPENTTLKSLGTSDLRLLANSPPDNGRSPLEKLFQEAYDADPFPDRILQMLRDGTHQSKEISLSECKEVDGRLYLRPGR